MQDYIGHVSALSIDLQSRLAQAKATKEDERPPFHKTRIDNLNALTRPFAELNMAFEALHSQKEDKRDTEKYAAVYKEWEHIIMQEVETVEMIADDLLSEVEALVTHSEDGLKDDDKNNVIPSIEASLAQSSLWAMGIINRLWNKLTASDKKIITEVKASLDEIKNILDKIKGSQG